MEGTTETFGWLSLANLSPWVAIVKDILAAVAAGLAVWGLRAWRRDFIGKRRIELAEDALRLFYQARDAITAMRAPTAFGSEMADVVRGENESSAKFHWRQTVAPLFGRYNERTEMFAQLAALRYRFMARFGEKSAEPFVEIQTIVHRLFVSAHMLVQTADADDSPMPMDDAGDVLALARERRRQERRKWEDDIWGVGGDDDKVAKDVDAIVARIEARCRPIIK